MLRKLKPTIRLLVRTRRFLDRLNYAGLVVLALAAAWWIVSGVVDLRVVFDAVGGGFVGALGIAGGIILLPFTLGLAPLYALSASGDWIPLLATCAGSPALLLVAPRTRGWMNSR